MSYNLKILKVSRQNILNLIEPFNLEQLNHIPKGFSNNLIWNFGHMIVTQQLLCYSLSGLEPKIEGDLIDAYRKGSTPSTAVNQEEVDLFKNLAISTVHQLESDLEAGIFQNYKEYPTSFGISLSSIEEAIQFNNVHEGLHLGYAMAIRKLL
jgi:hypothetical protein